MAKTLNTLAVVSQSGESLSFFDIATGERTGQVKCLAPEPHELAYDDRTNVLYITHAYRHGWYAGHGEPGVEISVVDCSTRQVVDIIDISPYGGPHGIFIDKPRNVMYVSIEYGLKDGGGLLGIDLETRKIVKAIPSQWKSHWFVLTPDGKKAYTSNKEAGYISVMDVENGRMTGKIEAPGGNEQPGISNDGRFVYFPSPTLGVGMRQTSGFHVQVIDTSTDEVVKTIALGNNGSAVHVDAKDRLSLPGKLTVLAPPQGDFRKLGEVDTGLAPLTVYASPNATMAFTANIFEGTVTMIDLQNMSVAKTIEVDVDRRADKQFHQGSHGMALVP